MQRLAGRHMGFVLGVGTLVLMLGASPALAGDTGSVSTSSNSLNNAAALRGFDLSVITTGTVFPPASHPDTSNMSAYLNGSTQFGVGVAQGTSDMTVCFMRADCAFTANTGGFPETNTQFAQADVTNPLPTSGYYSLGSVKDGNDGSGNPLFSQDLKNEFLSYAVNPAANCRNLAAQAGQARCNLLDYGFNQDVAMVGPGSAAAPRGDGDQVFDLFFSVDALVDANGNLVGQAKGSYAQAFTDVTNGVQSTKSCSGTFAYSTTGGYTLLSGSAGTNGCP